MQKMNISEGNNHFVKSNIPIIEYRELYERNKSLSPTLHVFFRINHQFISILIFSKYVIRCHMIVREQSISSQNNQH